MTHYGTSALCKYKHTYQKFCSQRYGDVFWKFLDSVDLDPSLVQRFEDKTMAIVGYEANVVITVFASLCFHADNFMMPLPSIVGVPK